MREILETMVIQTWASMMIENGKSRSIAKTHRNCVSELFVLVLGGSTDFKIIGELLYPLVFLN